MGSARGGGGGKNRGVEKPKPARPSQGTQETARKGPLYWAGGGEVVVGGERVLGQLFHKVPGHQLCTADI